MSSRLQFGTNIGNLLAIRRVFGRPRRHLGQMLLELGSRPFERGVEGETLACGTGAAATAIALAARGRVRAPVTLDVASGDALEVRFEAPANGSGAVRAVTLVGPVATSFEGSFDWQPPGRAARAGTDR